MNSTNNKNRVLDTLFVMNDSDFICHNCNSLLFNLGEDYVKICKICKTKTSITKNTIFDNVRFGLLKAFDIAIEYYNSNYSITSVDISNKYNISQKTAWGYLNKIKENKEFIYKLIEYNSKKESEIQNMVKLKKYLINH